MKRTSQIVSLVFALFIVSAVGLVPALARARASEQAAAPAQSAGVDRIEVKVDGMACPFCAYGIEKKLRALPGARNVMVDLGAGTATVEAPSGTLEEEQIRRAIKDAGFTASSIKIARKAP